MTISSNRFVWRIAILLCIVLGGSLGVTYSTSAHENSPGTPSQYKLPFAPNRLAKITAGPNMGRHGVDACCLISREAIDFVWVATDYWSGVRAAKAGTVIYAADPGDGYGRTVIIQHSDGFFSYYEHLDDITPNILNTNVSRGFQIGIIGRTGTSLIHLHFEVRDGVQTSPLVVGSGDSRGHAIIDSNRFYRRIGLFPWYPDADMSSGFIPQSTSHPVGICLSNRNLAMRWLAPNEFDHLENSANNADRFQGYDWDLDHATQTVPTGTLENGSAISNAITFYNLADGDYWFHMRAYSTQYGWAPASSVSHIGPFKIRYNCPQSPSAADWLADPD